MIFIAGISSKQKQLDFHQTMICPHCGQYGHYKVFMEYLYFSFFFLPLFKWNKKYYVKSSCCNCIYTISKELGSCIERGENVTLKEEDLELFYDAGVNIAGKCPRCNKEIDLNYQYCPYCGTPLK
ncbi:zinc ribbon domain-containing protein [Garciella nitratireducens]|uniref:zinc ribbon domain-containing protein n=1 Tax=Garciella nitratireducens TaxID=218205 RepID=UPI000DE9057D|nr:zinc ribbon domain-containing protein [Garciella nitratireducens]RBP42761.1 zinc ribbon family protein [Garciella nitratireducens]